MALDFIRLFNNQKLLNINQMIVGCNEEAVIRDENLLQSSIAAAFQTFDGINLYRNAEDKAAKLFQSLIKNHPFVNGNKRTALCIFILFIRINKINIKYTQQDLIDLTLNVANSSYGILQIVNWINDRKI